ncbi:MAG: hypothetical protein ACI89U_001157 [Gammaproteobacteria bacterium]|jgi:hypothetical protein
MANNLRRIAITTVLSIIFHAWIIAYTQKWQSS